MIYQMLMEFFYLKYQGKRHVENFHGLLTLLKTYDIIIQNKYFVSNRGQKIIQNMGNIIFLLKKTEFNNHN